MRRRKTEDGDACALATKLLAHYRGSVPLVAAFSTAAEGNAGLEAIASKFRMSCLIDEMELHKLENRNLAELVRIVAHGIESGSNVRRALALLRSRIEIETKQKNRFRAKSRGAVTLTYMGMGVFFPLFSGISSVILTSSVGGTYAVGALARGFLLVSMLYPPIILYLSSAFAHPERRIPQNLLAIAPYLALASAVTLITRNYLSGML